MILYTLESFWEGGTPSGDMDAYDIDCLWEARYPYGEAKPLDQPIEYFEGHLTAWSSPWGGFGGDPTRIWQFTPAGLVAGRYIDVNVASLSMNDLRSLAVTAGPNEPEDREPVPEAPDNPHPGVTLMQRVKQVEQYGLNLLRVRPKYWCWDGGNLNVARPSAGRPASNDGPAPKPDNVKRMFCADIISFQLRLLGLPIPKNHFGNQNYDGGTRSFQLRYGSQMKPLKLSECREGDVVFVDFQTRWAPEGHIAFCLGDGPNAKLLQSHLEQSCAGGEPGLNNMYTLAQSHGNGYYTKRIPREAIWGKPA